MKQKNKIRRCIHCLLPLKHLDKWGEIKDPDYPPGTGWILHAEPLYTEVGVGFIYEHPRMRPNDFYWVEE